MIQRKSGDKFNFQVIPPDEKGIFSEEGDASSLLLKMPYLFVFKLIPNELVVNFVLAQGYYDGGQLGGLQWEPFRLCKKDFSCLVCELGNKKKGLEYVEPAKWVETPEDWRIWCFYVKKGVPWKEHKRLNDLYISIKDNLDAAKKSGDESRTAELHLQSIDVGESLAKICHGEF